MAAQLKSRVLAREEKGFLTISMKRLLGCAMAGGGGFMFTSFIPPLKPFGMPLFIFLMILALYLSGSRDGISRFKYLTMSLTGNLMLDAARRPESLAATLCRLIQTDPAGVRVDGPALFAAVITRENDEWMDFDIIDSLDDQQGVQIVRDVSDVLIVEDA